MEASTSAIPLAFYPIDTPPSANVNLDANDGPRIVGISAFLIAISGLIVSLRFTARYLSTAGIWWDDWFCLAAMLVSWGCCILSFIVTPHGFGKHEAAQSLNNAIEDSVILFKALYAYQTLYTIAVTLAKGSIIIFYGRIFTEKNFKIALWTVSGLVIAWYVAVQIIQFAECRPLHALWDGNYADQCIDLITFYLAAGAVNCVFNFILLIMPLPMIWSLEIGKRAKAGLSATFLLGVFVFAVSVARLVFIRRIRNVDVTWTYVDAAIWTTVEPVIAVCSASLPILRSLWVILRPSDSAQNSARIRNSGSRRYEKQVNFVDTPNTINTGPEFSDREIVPHGAIGDFDGEAHVYAPSPLSQHSEDEESSLGHRDLSNLSSAAMSRSRTVKSDKDDIISPISVSSSKERFSYLAPSSSMAKASNKDRGMSLVSKFSPMGTIKPSEPSGARSPGTFRSESPHTIELNRLPIQGGSHDQDFEADASQGEDKLQQSLSYRQDGPSPVSSILRHESYQTSGRERSTCGTQEAQNPQIELSSRSQALGSERSIRTMEFDVRDNRRWSLKKTRGDKR